MSKRTIMNDESADGPVVTDYGLQINLRDIRKRAGIEAKEIAQAVERSEGTVSRWETGKGVIVSRELPSIAKAYNCDVTQIFSLPDHVASNRQAPFIDTARHAEIERLRSEVGDLHNKLDAWMKQAQALLRQLSKVMPRAQVE